MRTVKLKNPRATPSWFIGDMAFAEYNAVKATFENIAFRCVLHIVSAC